MLQSGTFLADTKDDSMSVAAGPQPATTGQPAATPVDPSSVAAGVPIAVAGLFLLAWAGAGLAFASANPLPLPMAAGLGYGAAGLCIAWTMARVLQRLLRRRASRAIQSALAAQRAFQQDALDQFGDGLAIWDADDRLVMWNSRFAELMPRAASHLRRDMSYEDLLRVWIDCGYGPINAGERWIRNCLERRWLGENTEYRSFEGRELAFAEKASESGTTALAISDVTGLRDRERALRDSEERYSLALLASNEALWDFDLRTGKSYLAPRAQAMLAPEGDATPVLRTNWSEHVHPDDRAYQQAAWKRHLSGESEVYSVEYRIIDSSGEPRWVYDCGLALRDSTGTPYRIAGSLGDISERKRIEQALTAARDAAQLADRARTDFLANLTHELKTPLNVVIGFSQILSEDRKNGLTAEERQTYAEEIRQAGSRLDRLVSDLLDLARAGSADTPMADSQVDLMRCLTRAKELVTHRAQARGVTLELQADGAVPAFIGDLGKLKHAFFSFLGYVVDRCDADTTVHIMARHVPGIGISLHVAFALDGVTEARLHDALQPLTPDCASGVQRADGVDLALAVAESFVKLHGGTLDLSIPDADRVAAVLRLPEERVV